MLMKIAAQFGSLGISVGENIRKVPILGDELCSSFLTHTRHAIEIVARISTQRCIICVLRRGHSGALQYPSFVIERIVAYSTLVVQHTNVRIVNKLIAVPIASDDDDIVALFRSFCGNCGNQIIAFKASQLHPCDSHVIEKFSNQTQLLKQSVGSLFSLSFVFRNRNMTERGLRSIKDHENGIG